MGPPNQPVHPDALPFGGLWYGEPNAVANAIGYAEHRSRSHDAVIRVYDAAGNVIETHEHKGDFKEWSAQSEAISRRAVKRDDSLLQVKAVSGSTAPGRRLTNLARTDLPAPATQGSIRVMAYLSVFCLAHAGHSSRRHKLKAVTR